MDVERKPIFDGEFEVSADGRIFRARRSHYNTKLQEMKANGMRDGYRCICLNVSGKQKGCYVHRLVMLAFKGECPPNMQVAHLNGNRLDNRLENLAYVTVSENHLHKRAHGTATRGERNANAKLNDEKVREARRLYKEGMNQSAIARRFNVSVSTMHDVISGKNWAHVD